MPNEYSCDKALLGSLSSLLCTTNLKNLHFQTYLLPTITLHLLTHLSRPRRFGKSLFLDTLHNIFEGLYIYDKWDWEITYPVIKISWDGNLQTTQNLEKVALNSFRKNQKLLGIVYEEEDNISAQEGYMVSCKLYYIFSACIGVLK